MFNLKGLEDGFGATWHRLARKTTLGFWAVGVVLATTTGPFGTFNALTLPTRALFWAFVLAAAIIAANLVHTVAESLADPKRDTLRFDAWGIALMTVIFTPMVWLICLSFGPVAETGPATFWKYLFYVFVISCAATALRRLWPVLTSSAAPARVEERYPLSLVQTPRLLRRLTAEMRGDVQRLTAQNHHVIVVTDKGETLLRMRLTDAIDEMDPVEGFCVHRSHWVARAAIVGITRVNAHKTLVALRNGEEIPASRKYRVNLEKAGMMPPMEAEENSGSSAA